MLPSKSACTYTRFLCGGCCRRRRHHPSPVCLAGTETEINSGPAGMQGRRRRSNGRAVMRCVSDAFSDAAASAAAPVNHDYNGEERREQRRRKSRSDNYNARDKIIGTRCTLPIISCISSRVTPPQSSLLPSPADNRQSRVIFVKSNKN